MTATKPQFDRNAHGSLYDRGSADAYYRRPRSPHWYPNGTYNGTRITNLTTEEIKEYLAGYNDTVEAGDFKQW